MWQRFANSIGSLPYPKFCWRVGRTEKVKLLIAGQNLKAGTIGTTIQDLFQTAIIYLGESIREGLEKRISSWQRESLNQDYAHRSQKVSEGKAQRFYGLFVPKANKAYFATLPEPLAFSPAPPAPSAPDPVQQLERLWHLEVEDPAASRTNENGTRTNPVPESYDPLDPQITPALIQAVLSSYDAYKSQTKVIEQVWNVSRSGTSPKYRAAKWKFRRILKQHNRPLPGKPWGEDPNDFKSFHEIIQP